MAKVIPRLPFARMRDPGLTAFFASALAVGEARDAPDSRLAKWVSRFESTGNYLLSPLRCLPRPARLKPGLDAEEETLLVKALGLGIVKDGKVEKRTERASSYAGFSELAQDLQRLWDHGVRLL